MRWLEATKEAVNEDDDGPGALEALKKSYAIAAIKVNGTQLPPEKTNEQFEAPLSSEIDIILNSFTFKVGRTIMWFPIRLLHLLKRLKIIKHE